MEEMVSRKESRLDMKQAQILYKAINKDRLFCNLLSNNHSFHGLLG